MQARRNVSLERMRDKILLSYIPNMQKKKNSICVRIITSV